MKQESFIFKIMVPLVAAILSFMLCGVLIFFIGANPLVAYSYLFKGAFGSIGSIGETFIKATPLIFTGLSATFAYRCGVVNLGAEGQFIMGAIFSIWFSTGLFQLPGGIGIVLSLILGMIAGGLWGAIPGLLKAYRGLNEMIISLLLNYIATLFMSFLYTGPLKEASIPQTASVIDKFKLARMFTGSRVHTGILIALLVTIIIYYFLFNTSKGYQLRVVGLNPIAARVNGLNVEKFMLISFIVSGAIAGLGGSIEVHGAQYRLMAGFGKGFGFDGVVIALIGQLNPIGTVVVAYLFAVLRTGANSMQVAVGIPTVIVNIIQAMVIIFVVAGTAVIHLPQIKSFFNTYLKVGTKKS